MLLLHALDLLTDHRGISHFLNLHVILRTLFSFARQCHHGSDSSVSERSFEHQRGSPTVIKRPLGVVATSVINKVAIRQRMIVL